MEKQHRWTKDKLCKDIYLPEEFVDGGDFAPFTQLTKQVAFIGTRLASASHIIMFP